MSLLTFDNKGLFWWLEYVFLMREINVIHENYDLVHYKFFLSVLKKEYIMFELHGEIPLHGVSKFNLHF